MKTAKQIKEQAQHIKLAIGKLIHNPTISDIERKRYYQRLSAVFLAELRYLRNIDNHLCALTGRNIAKDEFYSTSIPANIYAK